MAETPRDEILLEDTFSIAAKKYSVSLSTKLLRYTELHAGKLENGARLQIIDIVGCHSKAGNVTNGDSTSSRQCEGKSNLKSVASITVFAYTAENMFESWNKPNRIQSRQRVAITFEICCGSTKEENEKTARVWTNVINCLSRGFLVKPSDVESCEPPPWGRFLVLINPHSGTGKARKIFHTQVAPMLEEAGIPFEEVVTDHAGHAKEMIQMLDLSEWQAVVFVSGDGLICEVINGLMQRKDWMTAIKTPVGVVPGGSANALASSINYAAGEPVALNPVLHSTFVLIKHTVTPMDLVMVQTPSQCIYSFLSLTWGLIADCDIDTEKLRCCGEVRFTLGALRSVATLPVYSGKLSFLPVAGYQLRQKTEDSSMPSQHSSSPSTREKHTLYPSSADQDGGEPVSSGDTAARACNHLEDSDTDNMHDAARGIQNRNETQVQPVDISAQCPVHGLGDKNTNKPEIKQSATNTEFPETASLTWHEATVRMSNASSPDLDLPSSSTDEICCQRKKNLPAKAAKERTDAMERGDGPAVSCLCLPHLNQAVNDDWLVMSGRFIMVCAIYQTHIGRDLFVAPSAALANGIIHLLIVREGISRYRLLKLLLSLRKGTHVESPYVEFVPVLAFRLEPECGRGHVAIDGERIDPVPLQAQVLPGIARVLTKQ